MGQRANYVIVGDGGFELFYSHWGANQVVRDFFWGPEHALAFVRAQDPTGEWLDEIWCEGGALVDVPKKTLLVFGGENLCYDPLLRRVTLASMQRVWAGWEVRWAREGLGDFVDHLGLSRDLVRSNQARETHDLAGLDTDDPEWPNGAVSVRLPAGDISLRRVDFNASDLLDFGPEAVDRLVARPGAATLRVPLYGDAAPNGGIHVDVAARRVDLWDPGYDQDQRAWPGWRLEHHGDRFEAQEEATGGALVFVTRPQPEVVEELMNHLMGTSNFDPKRLLDGINQSRPGARIEVNPHFFSYHPRELPVDERARILTWALAGLPALWRQVDP